VICQGCGGQGHLTQGEIFCIPKIKHKRSKSVFTVTVLALSCIHIWARFIQSLALSLVGVPVPSIPPYLRTSSTQRTRGTMTPVPEKCVSRVLQIPSPRCALLRMLLPLTSAWRLVFGGRKFLSKKSWEIWDTTMVGTRVPGIHNRDCARGCINRSQSRPIMSAINVCVWLWTPTVHNYFSISVQFFPPNGTGCTKLSAIKCDSKSIIWAFVFGSRTEPIWAPSRLSLCIHTPTAQ